MVETHWDQWVSVGLFAVFFCVTWVLYLLHDYRVVGYVLLGLSLIAKTVTYFAIEPEDAFILVKTYSIIPFSALMHYYRHDYPDSQWLPMLLMVVLALNIVEPAVINELPQGTYLNAITGFLLAALTLFVGWNTATVQNGSVVVLGFGWGYVSSYVVWHCCVMYALTYEVSTPGATFQGNYFVFDVVLNGLAVVLCIFSEHGPTSFYQTRAYTLYIKLTMNALWTSNRMPAEFVHRFFVGVAFDAQDYFFFQVIVLIGVCLCLLFAVRERLSRFRGARCDRAKEASDSFRRVDAAASGPKGGGDGGGQGVALDSVPAAVSV